MEGYLWFSLEKPRRFPVHLVLDVERRTQRPRHGTAATPGASASRKSVRNSATASMNRARIRSPAWHPTVRRFHRRRNRFPRIVQAVAAVPRRFRHGRQHSSRRGGFPLPSPANPARKSQFPSSGNSFSEIHHESISQPQRSPIPIHHHLHETAQRHVARSWSEKNPEPTTRRSRSTACSN